MIKQSEIRGITIIVTCILLALVFIKCKGKENSQSAINKEDKSPSPMSIAIKRRNLYLVLKDFLDLEDFDMTEQEFVEQMDSLEFSEKIYMHLKSTIGVKDIGTYNDFVYHYGLKQFKKPFEGNEIITNYFKLTVPKDWFEMDSKYQKIYSERIVNNLNKLNKSIATNGNLEIQNIFSKKADNPHLEYPLICLKYNYNPGFSELTFNEFKKEMKMLFTSLGYKIHNNALVDRSFSFNDDEETISIREIPSDNNKIVKVSKIHFTRNGLITLYLESEQDSLENNLIDFEEFTNSIVVTK